MASHPNQRARRPPAADPDRALIFAPDEGVAKWIDEEIAGQSLAIQIGRSIKEVVNALVQDPPPRPQILVADFDAMTAADALHLHAIRDQGWFGSIIALGKVPEELQSSLNIYRVLRRPLGSETLRDAVTAVGLHRPTAKMKKLDR